MFKFKYWIFLFASHSLYALTTLNVTLSTDNNPGGIGEIGDLRYCLNSMNQSLNSLPDDYAIVFAFPMTIQLNGILPIINNSSNPVNITIGNPGPIPTVTIDGNSGAYSGFFIPMGNVTIQNMIFQNLTAKGGNGGDGISGGGGGMGAGGAIYAPQSFLNGSNPSVTLMNVTINNCSAVGGNGGNYLGLSSTGDEGGAGGGGFSGNGGSITTTGTTGGAGGGGFGGNGGNVTLSTSALLGGGGGGGGGLGSLATIGILTNLGNGGSDQDSGLDGNGYGLTITAGSGGGGNNGGNNQACRYLVINSGTSESPEFTRQRDKYACGALAALRPFIFKSPTGLKNNTTTMADAFSDALYFSCGKTSGPKATRDYAPRRSAFLGAQRREVVEVEPLQEESRFLEEAAVEVPEVMDSNLKALYPHCAD